MKRLAITFAFASTTLAAACAMAPSKSGSPPPSSESYPPPPPAPPPNAGVAPTSGVPESDKGGTTSTGSTSTGTGTAAATDVPVGPTNIPGTQPKPPTPTTMPKDPLPADLGAAQAAFDKSAASFGVAGNDCQQLCKALASMQNAADHLCELTKGGGEKKRCTDAQGRVTSAKERVKQTCGGCGP